MTTLTLRIENHATLDNGGPVTLTLTGKGAQVGRKSGNDWVLPDPSRHISGHHFDVSFENDAYFLTDVSSNGTFIHGERYRIDGTHQIADGDRFTVGQYIIKAELTADVPQPETEPPMATPQQPAAPYSPPPGPPAPPAPPQIDEFNDVWGDLGGDGSLQAPPPRQALTPSPAASVQAPGEYGQEPTGGAVPQQPDFSQMGAAPGVAPAAPTAFPIPGERSVAASPAIGTPPSAEPAAQPPMPPVPDPAAPGIGSEGFGIAQSATPPQPVAPQPQAAPVYPPTANTDAFLRAFMEGAGITDASQLQIPPEHLGRILGQVARVGTNELMRMLQDRAAVKLFVSNEDRTMRVATGNNPMKFMIDSDQAFEAMFLEPREGYLTGADGFENALSDIRRHQAAVIAALQPALAEMLVGLAPDEIEGEISGGIMGGSSRKAWDEFTKRWEARAAQGENGMLDAFIKAFSRHYAEALRKM